MKLPYLVGLLIGTIFLVVLSCTNKDTEFRDFFNGHEVVYPGVATKVIPRTGKNKAALEFTASPDPSIVKYVVLWNNKRDSLVFNDLTTDASGRLSLWIPNLSEYTYSFTIYSVDGKGNRSIPLEINNVKVYGDIYENNLLNRAYDVDHPYDYDYDLHKVTLRFLPTDTIDGFNISTLIRYETTANKIVEKTLAPDQNDITLSDYKHGTEIAYRSTYVPERNALDTFAVKDFASYATVYALLECDKRLFAEVKLPFDVGIYNGDQCPVRKLWDGSVGPQGYPNIFHAADGSKMPQAITFDMGKSYTHLAMLEETGRDCCGNPLRFEVWGIDNMDNAAPNVDPSDPSWRQQTLDMGWTLLRDVIRTDDGKAAMRFDLMQDPPPVRFIRIRITEVHGGGNTSNMSELTFWNKQ